MEITVFKTRSFPYVTAMRMWIFIVLICFLLGAVWVMADGVYSDWRWQSYEHHHRTVSSGKTLEVHDFDVALEVNQSDFMAFQGRAKARARLGDNLGALKDIDTAMKLSPRLGMNHLVRADLLLSLSNPKGALHECDIACNVEPMNFICFEERAMERCFQRDYRGALLDLDRVDLLNPESICSLKLRGLVHERLGDRLGATRDHQRYWKLDPCSTSDPYDGVLAFALRNTASAIWDLSEGVSNSK